MGVTVGGGAGAVLPAVEGGMAVIELPSSRLRRRVQQA
jgi:hypothetical protein